MAAQEATILDVFGGQDIDIQTKDGTCKLSTLVGKYVGLYFSAHWCPPCRGFTPKLAAYYNKVKETTDNFEIIFVSSDRNQGAFDEYYAEHPWLALPFSNRDMKGTLSSKFKVQGIPTLVLINPAGEMYNDKGRQIISKPVADFPWAPPTMNDILTDNLGLVDNAGNTSTWGDLAGKTVGIYLSAHWCPPCKAFTPKLVQRYAKAQELGKNFEIVFTSWDKNQSQFEEYFAEMPWKAIPYENKSIRDAVGDVFDCSGIPRLVMLDMTDGTPSIIRDNAKGPCESDPELEEFPWVKPPMSDVAKDVEGIDELPSIILMQTTSTDDDKAARSDFLMEIAVEQQELAKERKYNCFTANTDCSILNRIKALTGQKDDGVMMLLDLQNNGAFYTVDLPSSTDDIRAFLNGYENKNIERKQCKR
jgi:nucleoredoxin